MSSLSRALALHLVVFISIGLSAEEPALEPHDGVLVLRNGFVLQGHITPINDVFLVSMGASGEVRLPRAEVQFQCRDLDDAYLQQRDALISDEPTAHLQLADWCLRHGLLARAADQLLVVYSQDPRNSQLRTLDRRLLSLGNRSEKVANDSNSTADSTAPPIPAKSRLSPQTMQHFSTIIQPILFNRCATHTCHGNGGSSKFRLIRPALGHAATSRMTQRNLQAMLSFIDHQHPEKSPLLVQGNTPHGGSETPAFTDKQFHQFELLESWVRRAASTPEESIATNSGGPKRPRDSTAAAKPIAQAGYESPADLKSAVAPAAAHSNAAPQVPPANGAIPADNSNSRDPFDPEIFNRRYHPAAPTAPSEP